MSKFGKMLEIIRKLRKEGKTTESLYHVSYGSSWRKMSDSRFAYIKERSSCLYWSEEDYTFYVGIGGMLSGIFSDLKKIEKEMTEVFFEANPDEIKINVELNCVEMTFREIVATITIRESCVLNPEERDLLGDKVFSSLWEDFDQEGRLIYRENGTNSFEDVVSPKRKILLQIYPSDRGARKAYDNHTKERRRCQESLF